MLLRFHRETRDVYEVLVSELAYSSAATFIMGCTLTGVAALAWHATSNVIFTLGGALGAAATLGKLLLMAHQRRNAASGLPDIRTTVAWEDLHKGTTIAMAGANAAVSATLFCLPEAQWHVLGTALLFGYTSGIVSRIGIRPWMAIAALCVAALPVIAASAAWHDLPHRITSLMFCVFLLGSFESVHHVHDKAVRHIASRLDMATLARNDPLTGLANRLGFREAFRALARGRPMLAIHCLDLDGFKRVNDRFGHALGDALLVEVARRLVVEAGRGAIVARFGGDEFVVLHRIEHHDDAAALAQAISQALRMPFQLHDETVTIGASLGYAVTADAEIDLDRLLGTADTASYRVKRRGGGVERATSAEDDRRAAGSPLRIAA